MVLAGELWVKFGRPLGVLRLVGRRGRICSGDPLGEGIRRTMASKADRGMSQREFFWSSRFWRRWTALLYCFFVYSRRSRGMRGVELYISKVTFEWSQWLASDLELTQGIPRSSHKHASLWCGHGRQNRFRFHCNRCLCSVGLNT